MALVEIIKVTVNYFFECVREKLSKFIFYVIRCRIFFKRPAINLFNLFHMKLLISKVNKFYAYFSFGRGQRSNRNAGR